MKQVQNSFIELQSSWFHAKELLNRHRSKHKHYFTKNNLLIAFLHDVNASTHEFSKSLKQHSKKKAQHIHKILNQLQGERKIFTKKKGKITDLIHNLMLAQTLQNTWNKAKHNTKHIENDIQLHISDIEKHISSMSYEYKKIVETEIKEK